MRGRRSALRGRMRAHSGSRQTSAPVRRARQESFFHLREAFHSNTTRPPLNIAGKTRAEHSTTEFHLPSTVRNTPLLGKRFCIGIYSADRSRPASNLNHGVFRAADLPLN